MRLSVLLGLSLSLLAWPAFAQQPALPGAPQPGAAPTTPMLPPTPGAELTGPGETIGQAYSVELHSGPSFTGTLQAATERDLTFATRDLGMVTVQRANLRQLRALSAEQARRGYDDVGNGTRLLFAPTARNLRRGEGYVQDIDVYLIGGNYGITNNISVGVIIPVLPFVFGNVLVLTPKVSVPITEKFSVGAGALYARAFGYGGGALYGVGTYGTADDNATLGLGYGFADGEDNFSSPAVLLGGAKRVSNRLSIIDETYFADGGLAGLLGGRYHTPRFSASLGFVYGTGVGGIYPAYLEGSYHFGRRKARR